MIQIWLACGWKAYVDSPTFFLGLEGQLSHSMLVYRIAKDAAAHLSLIKQRWSDILPLLEKEIDVGDISANGTTQSDGICDGSIVLF